MIERTMIILMTVIYLSMTLVNCSVVTFDKVQLESSVKQVEIGKTFELFCSATQLTKQAIDYDILFFHNSSEIAKWSYKVNGPEPKFSSRAMTNIMIIYSGVSENPKFSILIDPITESAKGEYQCKLSTIETDLGGQSNSQTFPSNVYKTNGSYIIIPSIIMLTFATIFSIQMNII
ncbi:hypothetical protein RDWZM_007833 [Blomia tropicalis]|uniref:Ig-like domain-containing protein n=1 Tax=Blomia tropicalis TaxID=40697 RepID=A0A9Q0M0F1_BLOTA|nr:hypothetical protein RDWZM_007833 [Blomia tropicalis]